MKEYYEIIKELREDNDIKQEDLCKKLNISQQSLSKYENNKRRLPIDILKRYAEFFKVSTDYILGLTKDKNPNWKDKVWKKARKWKK